MCRTIGLCTLSAAAQTVSSAIFFRCTRIKLLYIDINVIASYRIAYKENIDISYKLDIPPSPTLFLEKENPFFKIPSFVTSLSSALDCWSHSFLFRVLQDWMNCLSSSSSQNHRYNLTFESGSWTSLCRNSGPSVTLSFIFFFAANSLRECVVIQRATIEL